MSSRTDYNAGEVMRRRGRYEPRKKAKNYELRIMRYVKNKTKLFQHMTAQSIHEAD